MALLQKELDIRVSSEIGRLRAVIVHTPGTEIARVNPENAEDLLFDDIVYLKDARKEHRNMLRLFRAAMPADGNVIEILRLIRECFGLEDARAFFVDQLARLLHAEDRVTHETELLALDPDEISKFAFAGTHPSIPHFELHPIPNILFTRDLAAVVNSGIILSNAAKRARSRESILFDMLVRYHPMFESVKNKSLRLSGSDTVEGGDILIPSPELALIGMSERTSFSGILNVTKAMFEFGIKDVLVVDIPKQRASMHLDTIFTFTSKDECIVFPPAITGSTGNVVRLSDDNGRMITTLMPSLKTALEASTGHDFRFISCGGADPLNQRREQWTDGANVFALAPGVVVGYERNTLTFNELANHGYTVMNQFDFIAEYEEKDFEPDENTKIAISFVGNELCRGRGGARCMTMPILRDDIHPAVSE